MSVKRFCDGCGADMGSCRFPAGFELPARDGRPARLVELRPVDPLAGNVEIDVCRACIDEGLKREPAPGLKPEGAS